MRDAIINFFLKRHLLANLLFLAVFVGGIIAWNKIPKEELPDITFDTVRISVRYPGASSRRGGILRYQAYRGSGQGPGRGIQHQEPDRRGELQRSSGD